MGVGAEGKEGTIVRGRGLFYAGPSGRKEFFQKEDEEVKGKKGRLVVFAGFW